MSYSVPKRDRPPAWAKMQAIMPLLKSSCQGRERLLQQIAARFHVSPNTVRRWYNRFLTSGYSGLSKKSRSDKGSSRFFSKHPYAVLLVHQRWAPNVSILSIHKALQRELLQAPDYRTLREYIQSIPFARAQ